MNDVLRALANIALVIDSKQEFADAQSCAGSISAANFSSNNLDAGVADPNSGAGSPVWLACYLTASMTTGSATSTVQFILHDSDDESTWTEIIKTKAYNMSAAEPARAGVGFIFFNIPLPAQHKRYLRIARVIVATAQAAGTYEAFLHNGGFKGVPVV